MAKFWSRVGEWFGLKRQAELDSYFLSPNYGVPSQTGIIINQQSAMREATAGLCIRILSEDISKMTPRLYRRLANDDRAEITSGAIADVLWQPNDWTTWPEFSRQMVAAYCLRGNAWAPIVRNGRGEPLSMIPVNPDQASLWQGPDGQLFVQVVRNGFHQTAELSSFGYLIPYSDVLHLKMFSLDGLLGVSPIDLGRETIALGLAQEQQLARLMKDGARPSGVLTTDQTISEDLALKLKQNWKDLHSGLQNSGQTCVLEAGLTWQPLTLTSVDMEFMAQRNYQVNEICRLWRIPPHMVGSPESRLTGTTLVQIVQEYRNSVLTSHSNIWERRLDMAFGLRGQKLFVDLDEDATLKADLTARYAAYRVSILTGFMTQNEVRRKEGLPQKPGAADDLLVPANMIEQIDGQAATPAASAPASAEAGAPGADATGVAPDGAGRPTQAEGPVPLRIIRTREIP